MSASTMTGASLEKALRDKTLPKPGSQLTGVVKESASPGHIAFSLSGCGGGWVDLGVEMIESVELIGTSACGDHAHPVATLTIREPADPAARSLLALLKSATAAPAAGAGVTPGPAAASMARIGGGFGPGVFAGVGGGRGGWPCRMVQVWVQCGTPLPGYPPPMCPEWVLICTF